MKSEFKKLIIDIKVHDLDRAIGFYQNILGLPLIHKESDWTSFEAVGAEIHLYIHGGIEHGLEFRVSDIEKEVGILKAKGVQFFVDENQVNLLKVTGEIMEFPWGKATYFKDSEDNQIALVQDQ